jgi:uncharacterized protein YndB with AHSA1/START domain
MSLDATLAHRDGTWVLTMSRRLRHPAAVVWPWLIDPERLARWSPVVPDIAFDAVGARSVREQPGDDPVDGEVLTVDPPHVLVHRWGPNVLRWQLTDADTGCLLTLEQSMANPDPAASNAAGWHLCLDVLEPALDGSDGPRIVGPDALAAGWEVLRDRYAATLNA